MLKIIADENILEENLANTLYKELSQTADIKVEVILASEEEIQKLNAENRGVNAVTDVLSFPMLEGVKGKVIKEKDFPLDVDFEDGFIFLGSIAICLNRVISQAKEYGHSEKREINYLILHGLLHLFGYDHIEEKDRAEMREIEEKVLNKLDIGR